MHKTDLTLSKLHPLTQKCITEFSKTAGVIEKEPWFLTDAANYLRRWVADNQNPNYVAVTVPALEFIFAAPTSRDFQMVVPDGPQIPICIDKQSAVLVLRDCCSHVRWEKYAPGAIRTISAVPRIDPAGRQGKRKNTDQEGAQVVQPAVAPPAGRGRAGRGHGRAGRGQGRAGRSVGRDGSEEQAEVLGVPAAAPAAPAAVEQLLPGAAELPVPPLPPAGQLGCGRCRGSRLGCATCKAPQYQRRGAAAGRGGRGRGRGRGHAVAAEPVLEPAPPAQQLAPPVMARRVRGRGRGGRAAEQEEEERNTVARRALARGGRGRGRGAVGGRH